MKIRASIKSDSNSIFKVIESAFPSEEQEEIKIFVSGLLFKRNSPKILTLVAEINSEVIGFISFSPIFIDSDLNYPGYILAPLVVSPNHQNQGIGSSLINAGIALLNKSMVDLLLVYGDPNYYGRFGFNNDVARLFIPPYELKHPLGWLGMMLVNRPIPNQSVSFSCVEALKNPDLW